MLVRSSLAIAVPGRARGIQVAAWEVAVGERPLVAARSGPPGRAG